MAPQASHTVQGQGNGGVCVEKDDMPPLRRHMLSQVNEGGMQRKDIMPPLRHHMLSQKNGEGV